MNANAAETAIAIEPIRLEIPKQQLDESCERIVATRRPAFGSLL
jgi:hypothetical protein